MSHANPTTSSSPNFQLIFNNALEAYRRRTRKDPLVHPLFAQLQDCNSPSDVLALINQQLQGLERDDERLTRWVDPTVRVLYTFSETLGEGVSLVCIETQEIDSSEIHSFISISQAFSPAKVIFVGVRVLLSVRILVVLSRGLL
jgi:hypothetical protein